MLEDGLGPGAMDSRQQGKHRRRAEEVDAELAATVQLSDDNRDHADSLAAALSRATQALLKSS